MRTVFWRFGLRWLRRRLIAFKLARPIRNANCGAVGRYPARFKIREPPMLFDAPLWNRINAVALDAPGGVLPFSRRLARDMGWSQTYTRRAIAEYRRFLYLSQTAGHIVTPSEDVDAVWHMHMTYTRSYWRDLCRDALGRELHHTPTAGGAAETARYRALYEQTRQSYEAAFGAAPPADIWPDSDIRFAPKRIRAVDTDRYWTIPKQPLRMIGRTFGANALTGAALVATTGLAYAAGGSGGLLGLPTWAWGVIAAAIVLAIVRSRRKPRGPRSARRSNSRDGDTGFAHDNGRDAGAAGGKSAPDAGGAAGPSTATIAVAGAAVAAATVAGAAAAQGVASAQQDGEASGEPVANDPGGATQAGSDNSSGGWFSGLFSGGSDDSSGDSGDSGDSGCGGGCGGD